MTKEQKLEKLIEEIEKKDKARGLPDGYLREHNYMTREDIGIGEYSYGIIMIPIDFVLDYLKELQEALSMLKEKDSEIERLEQTLARNIARNVTSSMKESAKSNEDLEMLNQGWQIELEKKDKIIDLMATFIDAQNTRMLEDEYTAIKNIYTIIGLDKDKEEIKQYFERKSEE